MKNLSLIILLIAATFASCSSDDDAAPQQAPTNTSLIIGKWNVTSIVIDEDTLGTDDCELNSTLEIKADGTYLEQTYGGFAGNCSPDSPDNGTWEVLNNTFIQKGDTNFSTTILELNDTTLKYEFEDEDILLDGTVIPFKEVWTFTRSK